MNEIDYAHFDPILSISGFSTINMRCFAYYLKMKSLRFVTHKHTLIVSKEEEPSMKLTEKQKAALSHIQAGEVQNHRFGYGAWRITGPVQPTVVGRVISLGLARWQYAPQTDSVQIAVLTETGREAQQQ